MDATQLREGVRGQWVASLGHGEFTDEDDFFVIGGHSLLVAEIMAGVSGLVGRRVSLRLFFENPTVSELTSAVLEEDAVANVR